MTTIDLEVPHEEQTVELAREYYQFQMNNGGYDPSVAIEDKPGFQRFKKRFEENGAFRLSERITHKVTDVVGPRLQSTVMEHRDWVISDEDGLTALIDALEDAHQTLRADGDLEDGTEQAIQQVLNLVRFAKNHDYGVGCDI